MFTSGIDKQQGGTRQMRGETKGEPGEQAALAGRNECRCKYDCDRDAMVDG
jgi:hypothetical protein